MTAKKTTKPLEVSDFTELRLLELGAENFKRVKLVRIRPKGNVTEITGRNGQGKTSLIESFLSLFAGKAGVASQPIRKGSDEATSYAILGKDEKPLVTISQRIWEKKGGGLSREITVEGADGTDFKHPQTIASALYAPIAFDPFQFQRMPEKDKVELLKRLVPGVDFAAIAHERKTLFDKRTDEGRDRDRAAARWAGIELPDARTPLVDVTALAGSLATLIKENGVIDERARRRSEARADLETKRDAIEAMQARLATMIREADEIENKIDEAEELPEKHDTAAIEAQIANAEASNKEAALWVAYDIAKSEEGTHDTEYVLLTKEIERLDKKKTDAIAAAKLPVRDLEFDDEGVTLNGLPFAQASSAEQLKASTLLAMATNPDLRVVIIREGSLLDEDSMELLTSIAVEHGYDLLVERVTNGEKVGIVIEDGEVAS